MVRPRLVLSGLTPTLKGLQWETDTALRIGRHDSADIVLHDPTLGRNQAEATFRDGKWMIRDLARSDRHPTLLNGRALSGETQLRLNDVLQFGSVALQAAVVQEPVQEAPIVVDGSPRSIPGSCIKASGSFLRVEAAAQHSWDEALSAMSQKRSDLGNKHDHVFTLLRTGHHLCHIGSLEDLLQAVLADAVAALKAQRGSILLADPKTGRLQLRTSYAPKLPRGLDCCYSRTMAERSFQQGESLLCSDVSTEADLQSARSVRVGTMSSLMCAVLRSPRKRLGILQLDRGPTQLPFDEDDFFLADAVAASVAIGIESAQLIEEQREQFAQTVSSLARAVEVRDYSTGNHTRRVTDYALLLADELKLTPAQRYQIQIGTPLHDIGKIGIDDSILRKPGKLTDGEYEQMKLHTIKGAAILESFNALNSMIPIVRHHHERWDGAGYPDGLAADKIAQTARIVAVADAFDAMTSDRPYRSAMATDLAFAELVAKSGTHFDPACVQAFLRLRPYVEQLMLQR
ncbi:MAG TPA: HD domain-containing phosphohydrolase [Gemmataceae bacterium]|nr:HD domain-containing phosphohydrolase [Gemmataceae bacterium]